VGINVSLKEYKFNTKQDFIYYINHLIVGISKSIDALEEQYIDLGEYIEERNLRDRPNRVILYKTYEKYLYLLDGPVGDLLNLFGDNAEYGSSYKNYRKNIKKKSKELNIDYVIFTQEQEAELNAVTTARDWGHHAAVSLINSTEEKAFGAILDASHPIYIPKYKKCSGRMLVNWYDSHTKSLEGYKRLFELLKKDYNKLTGYPCIILKEVLNDKFDDDLIISKISANIQTKIIKTNEDIQNVYNQRTYR